MLRLSNLEEGLIVEWDPSEEQIENVHKWIAALRSGEYAQGSERLYIDDPVSDDRSFCCLGVACEISDTLDSVIKAEREQGRDPLLPLRGFIPEQYGQKVLCSRHMDEAELSFYVQYDGVAKGVHVLNDGGVTFQEIAGLIELTLEEALE